MVIIFYFLDDLWALYLFFPNHIVCLYKFTLIPNVQVSLWSHTMRIKTAWYMRKNIGLWVRMVLVTECFWASLISFLPLGFLLGIWSGWTKWSLSFFWPNFLRKAYQYYLKLKMPWNRWLSNRNIGPSRWYKISVWFSMGTVTRVWSSCKSISFCKEKKSDFIPTLTTFSCATFRNLFFFFQGCPLDPAN